MQPQCIQLSRTRGWRKPDNAVVVARPTKWGNPWVVTLSRSVARAVALHRAWLLGELSDRDIAGTHIVATLNNRRQTVLAALPTLRGKDLACWCTPGEPCHGDVLLELANR